MANPCDVRWHAGLRHGLEDNYFAFSLGPRNNTLEFGSNVAEREVLTLERHREFLSTSKDLQQVVPRRAHTKPH